MGPRSRKSGQKGSSQSSAAASSVTKSGQSVNKPLINRQPSNEKRDNGFGVKSLINLLSPHSWTALKVSLSARICSAVWSNISDCDETFNYWEPVHFLIHGSGFQTWEYSPLYAIRSYFFLWFYALPAFLYTLLLQSNKILVFYFTRCLLALVCALCEVYFYKGCTRTFGPNVSRLTLTFLILSTGMFISSTALLPSTFSMYMTLLMFGAWMQQHLRVVLFAMAANVVVGWPFSCILCLPLALDMFSAKKRRFYLFKWAAIAGLAVTIPLILLDSYYYGKFVFAPLNIVLYNVLSKHGANIYGTEPWHFYFVNGLLNFNLTFVASLAALPVLATCKYFIKSRKSLVHLNHWIVLSSLLLWFVCFFPQAHKEERFLFPAYPLICLVAAFTLDTLSKAVNYLLPRLNYVFSFLIILTVALFSLLSLSRSLALYKGYHAPMNVYMELGRIHKENNIAATQLQLRVCVGKEWHRFPNSFFLPDSKRWELHFIESEFRGQLPKQYSKGPDATRIIPLDMNDRNLEEPTRYLNRSLCHFLIDSDYPTSSVRNPRYSLDTQTWQIVSSATFLDANATPQPWRSFYIPFISESKCKYINYNLLRNKQLPFKS